jgi:tRNA A37 threonylcarbamoyladenosine biosynthesis protein TsaE
VLVREYARPDEGDALRLYHVDFYRISGADEALGLGVDEFLGDERAVCIIEWAERARELIPAEHLWVRLVFPSPADQMCRTLYFSAQGERHTALLREFRRAAFGI